MALWADAHDENDGYKTFLVILGQLKGAFVDASFVHGQTMSDNTMPTAAIDQFYTISQPNPT